VKVVDKGVLVGAGVVGMDVVEAFATPRNCLTIEGRGMPIGLRNRSDIEELMYSRT